MFTITLTLPWGGVCELNLPMHRLTDNVAEAARMVESGDAKDFQVVVAD